jgi:hypothetical protein
MRGKVPDWRVIPSGGYHAATCDLTTVAAWAAEVPDDDLASDLEQAGLVQVDAEGAAKGYDPSMTVRALERVLGSLAPTRVHRTPSGGLHILYGRPLDRELRNVQVGRVGDVNGVVIEGVEIRTRGSLMLPPSRGYRVVRDFPIVAAPTWLLDLVTAPAVCAEDFTPGPRRFAEGEVGTRRGVAALEHAVGQICSARPGSRHTTLVSASVWALKFVVSGHLDGHEALDRLAEVGTLSGLSATEVNDALGWALSCAGMPA